jgi:transglutaminase-like putative cysteine protease
MPRQATFEARNEFKVTLPPAAKHARIWLAMPQEDALQTVTSFKVVGPMPHTITIDQSGNKAVYLELSDPKVREFGIVETFGISRKEQISGVNAKKAKPLSEAQKEEFAAYLGPNQHVIIDDRIKKLASEIVGEERNPVIAARKIYDWELANIDYWVKDPKNKKASPVGSTEYCLSSKTGNCTDFHSLWTSLARAAGIPTRIVYGSFFKKELDGQDADQSYHCWPEFYVSGQGWIPHDVAVADIFAGGFATNADNEKLVQLTTGDGYTGADQAKVNYYFGNIDERRVTWSRGRDLTLSPKQDGGPVNSLTKAYIEIDGKPAAEKEVWTRKLTFREIK